MRIEPVSPVTPIPAGLPRRDHEQPDKQPGKSFQEMLDEQDQERRD